MRKTLLVAAILAAVLCSASAFAGVLLTENWESYVSGATPYDGWTVGNGLFMGLVPIQGQAMDKQAYTVTAGATSRIGKAVGSDLSQATKVILDGYFYDSNGLSSTKRTFLGFQQDFAVNGALLRVGMNNNAHYQVHYYTSALQTVDTGVSNGTGWHHVTLTNTKVDATNWKTDWVLDTASGSFTWAWNAAGANKVVVGYNYSCGTEVNWDNISLAIPEPSSILALATGMIGLVGIIRRKRA